MHDLFLADESSRFSPNVPVCTTRCCYELLTYPRRGLLFPLPPGCEDQVRLKSGYPKKPVFLVRVEVDGLVLDLYQFYVREARVLLELDTLRYRFDRGGVDTRHIVGCREDHISGRKVARYVDVRFPRVPGESTKGAF